MRRCSGPSSRRVGAPCSVASLRCRFASFSPPASSSPAPAAAIKFALPSFARQADGAALVSQGATSVLATIVANRVEPRWHRELNLMVEYREPNAGFGRIPMNATKRDGAPMIKELQNAAMIEACMVAAFPDEYLCETQLSVSVLSQEAAHDPLIPALNAAALAYRVAPFPFKHEPWAAARCVIDEMGKVHINPPRDAVRAAVASLLIAATRSKIVWMDALASQGRTLSDETLDKILKRGLEAVHSALSAQGALVAARSVAPHPVSAKLVVLNKEVMDAAALIVGDGYKQVALLPRRASFEGMTKLNQSLVAALRNRFFRLQDYEADLACEALQSSAARWAALEAGARADGRLPAEARPLSVDLDPMPNAPHVRAILLSLGDTKVLAQQASGVARERESELDANGLPKRLFVQVTEPPSASTHVGKHSKKVEQREMHLSGLIERVVSPAVTLRHPGALSRVTLSLLDGDGGHMPAYVMATSLALAKQGQMAEAFAGLEMAVYDGGNGLDGSVLCDPTALESASADSHLNFAANGSGLIQLRISSRAGIDAARLPPLIAQAKPALSHLSAALKGLLPRIPAAEKLPIF